MLVKSIPIIFSVLFLTGCADNRITSKHVSRDQNSSLTGTLQGKVTIGPICPVETEEEPCKADPSLYTSHRLVILTMNGAIVKEADLDGNGNYSTQLTAGKYVVDFTPRDIGIPGSFQSPDAEIRAGEVTELNIEIDTGIR